MDAILNFATEFFEMLTKKQSEHLQTVFQVFQVFHFVFGPQNRPFLVQIRTKPQKTVPSHLLHLMVAENTQKGNPPTGLRTRSCPARYRRWFFRRSRLFVLFHTTQLHPSKPHQIKQPLSKIAVNERAVVNLQSLFSNHLISIFLFSLILGCVRENS